MNSIDLSYVAGLFDGEGTFVIYSCKVGKKERRFDSYFTGVAAIQIREKTIILWLQELFGGTVCLAKARKDNHSDTWVWKVTGKDRVLNFISKVAPFLKLKRKQAEVLQEFYLIRQGRNTSPITEQEWKLQNDLKTKMQLLNRVGVGK